MNQEEKKDPRQAIEVSVFEIGDEILVEGQICLFFHVILSGQVALSKDGKKIRILAEHDIFGLESLLLRTPSPYSARAWQECRVAKYSFEALDHLVQESPRMIQRLLVSISSQLNQTTLNLLDDPQPAATDNERIRYYKDGETILEERGGTDLYRLISTEGGLIATAGGRKVDRLFKLGEFFGPPVSGSHVRIKSIGESVVEKYDLDDLDIIVRDYPESAVSIMRAMVERLSEK